MAQSIIVVRVPEAEPFVATLRQRFDPAAGRGLGAHITLLYPFIAPERLERAVLGRLAAVAARVAPFTFQLTHLARFPGTLYLAPEPPAPFVTLSVQLLQEFPELSPQGRRAEALVPHLSVVRQSEVDDRAVEAQLEATLSEHGPIACRCRELLLTENSTGAWRPVRAFTLRGAVGGR